MKKTILILLAVVLTLSVLAVFTSCGETSADGETTVSDTSAVPDVTSVPQDTSEDTTAPDSEAPAVSDTTKDEPDVPATPVVKKAVISGGGAGSKTYSAAFALIDKKNPKVIVLCTAGRDTVSNIASYVNSMKKYSANVEAIALSTTLYDPAELREKILSADLIIVGGGQSEYMMDTWKKFNVDKYLVEAYNKGIVCIGGSAGGMCWTYAGWNDFYELPESDYRWFYGIDVVHWYYGPHFSNSAEWALFDKAILEITDPKYNEGYAMENGTAFVVIDGKIIKSIREAGTEHIYSYKFENGKWTKSEYKYD